MESLTASVLGWSIVAAGLGGALVCLLVLKYGFGTDDEIPDPAIRRRSLTRLGHGLAALFFGLAAVLALYSVADGTRPHSVIAGRLREPARALEERLRAAERVARQMAAHLGEVLRRADTMWGVSVQPARLAPPMATKVAPRSPELRESARVRGRDLDLPPTRLPVIEVPPVRSSTPSGTDQRQAASAGQTPNAIARPATPPAPTPPAARAATAPTTLGAALPGTTQRPTARELATSSVPPAPIDRSSPPASSPAPPTPVSAPPEVESVPRQSTVGQSIPRVPVETGTATVSTPEAPRVLREPKLPERAREQRVDKDESLQGRPVPGGGKLAVRAREHEGRRELPGHVERRGRRDRGERVERLERRDGPGRAVGGERPEGMDRIARPPRRERHERIERVERAERPERMEGTERPDRMDRRERVERIERAERAERVERPERVERVERPQRPERAARVERPERVERAERRERAERPERAGRGERPERHERAERRGR